ncbi:hypothetical protein [Nitrosococcus oceani]|uniref:Uncharacterized protein n=2 Tax=Nitrosococcus oceani TaxID=1229 RepID=Q3J7N5_NITOC|nr:hypothetical protein [Nitrosococcus oceani]KFI18393.1 hypothetical protein IB75_14370 [Nitrosococcus oceani C-27]ABA59161.1 hypothetical protein Noc_2708 [Nitrosococcus oceani ATCC 19707]EDZ65950.1 hypothetical protein NOC27_2630 [Nitrosococcus oceani AFC27]KFI21610.1 hypothetical protein HW44_13970 [Nitrosococcus oceani]GEM20309.1 hypothetical protein NONS58_17220 [Nitrosococcus oceani]
MNFQPSPLQALILWRLLTSEGRAYLTDIRPKPKRRDREALLEAKFIEEQWRRKPQGSRAIYVQLTDRAWAWAGEHMDAKLSHRSPAAGPILQSFLARLQPILQSRHITLAEIFSSTQAPPPSEDSEQQLREAYFHLSGGERNIRVRLAQLRQQLGAIPRPRLDELLLKLQREGKLVLSPLDDSREILPEDQKAALSVAGFKRHLVYMQK